MLHAIQRPTQISAHLRPHPPRQLLQSYPYPTALVEQDQSVVRSGQLRPQHLELAVEILYYWRYTRYELFHSPLRLVRGH